MAINYDKYLYSTGTHYIANSGSDENKQYKGGKAGDQTGHEWELKKWYNRPWTIVLRYPDQSVALTIAKLSIAAALNDKIGYDQNQRGTYWTQLKAVNYDPSAIKTACEEDCTAGVSANVKAAGYIHGIKALEDLPLCTSRNMRSQFTKAGFLALTDKKYLTGYEYLLPGDILLYESHHAAANVTLGKKVKEQWNPDYQPHPDDPDEPDDPDIPDEDDDDDDWEVDPPFAVITGSSVNIRKGPGVSYGILGQASKGDQLHYFGFADPEEGWLLVEFEMQTGWVSPKYAEIEDGDVEDIEYEDDDDDDESEPDGRDPPSYAHDADWWTSDIQHIFAKGVTAHITDVDTGLSWREQRRGGSNHADVQPLTAADTANLKQAYGGKWAWTRRAIWVTIDGQTFAASMNGMPHGGSSIKDNNFDGHHCIHFTNSRTHGTDRVDENHQKAIKKALSTPLGVEV